MKRRSNDKRPAAAGSILSEAQLGDLVTTYTDGIADLRDPDKRGVVAETGLAIAMRQAGRAAPGRKKGEPKLHARPRGGKSDLDPMVYLGKQSTGFRVSEWDKAEAFQRAKKLADLEEAVGRIIPATVSLAEVFDFYESRRKPRYGATAKQVHSYNKKKGKIGRLRASFPGTHLLDVDHESCAVYIDARSWMDGRNTEPDGSRRPVSIATIRSELQVLKEACRYWCAQTGSQYVPHVMVPPKGDPRLAWLTEAEMVRLMRAARGWVWDAEADRFRTIEVFDPEGVDMVWDGKAKTFRLERLGRPATVRRPYVDHARKREWRFIRRMLVMGYRTGTRHGALLGMRWTTDGLSGHIAFAPFDRERHTKRYREANTVFHRVGPKHADSTKGQKPIHAPDKLVALMRCWHASDIREGASHIVQAGDGRGYEGYVTRHIRAIAKAAGMAPMKVDPDDRRFVVRDEGRLHGAKLIEGVGRDAKPGPSVIDLVFHVVSRHTCAVWGLRRGASATEMAAYLSCTQAEFERTYGHWTILGTRRAQSALDDHEAAVARRAAWAGLRATEAAMLEAEAARRPVPGPSGPAAPRSVAAPDAPRREDGPGASNVIAWPLRRQDRAQATSAPS